MKQPDFSTLHALSIDDEQAFLALRGEILREFLLRMEDVEFLQNTQLNIETLREKEASPQGLADELWRLVDRNIQLLKSLAQELEHKLWVEQVGLAAGEEAKSSAA